LPLFGCAPVKSVYFCKPFRAKIVVILPVYDHKVELSTYFARFWADVNKN